MRCTARLGLTFVFCAAAFVGCATRPVPDFSGRWKPVNHFSESVQEIPLHPAYVFFSSPMDGTLKNMLQRWGVDSSMTLRYMHPSDFTLHARAASVRTRDLSEAAAALNAIYSEHGVAISVEDSHILVRQVMAQAPVASAPAAVEARPVP